MSTVKERKARGYKPNDADKVAIAAAETKRERRRARNLLNRPAQ